MPLLDHFRPPWSRLRPWDGFHAAWANSIVDRLNGELLPEGYVAIPLVTVGGRVEVDVATTTDPQPSGGGVATAPAVWAPPAPTLAEPIDFAHADEFAVRVFREDDSPRLVAAVELVSPANKDRASHRRAFVVKCAGYLQNGVGLIVVDAVTTRSGDLHAELLQLVRLPAARRAGRLLYATAYRTVGPVDQSRLEAWLEPLQVGAALPTLPLWISEERCLPVDLEQAHDDARRRLRMPPDVPAGRGAPATGPVQ